MIKKKAREALAYGACITFIILGVWVCVQRRWCVCNSCGPVLDECQPNESQFSFLHYADIRIIPAS